MAVKKLDGKLNNNNLSNLNNYIINFLFMSFGTKFYTWLKGHLVGVDELGNKYYCNSKDFESKSKKRWVIFEGEIEATKVPPHWHAWLHKTIDIPPVNYSKKYKWQKNHQPNMTGTEEAYYPKSHPLSKLKNTEKMKKEYERWEP